MDITVKRFDEDGGTAFSGARYLSIVIGEAKHGASCVLVLDRQPMSGLLAALLTESGLECSVGQHEHCRFTLCDVHFAKDFPFIYVRNADEQQVISIADSIIRKGCADAVMIKLFRGDTLFFLKANMTKCSEY
jgi:hypothetical protein